MRAADKFLNIKRRQQLQFSEKKQQKTKKTIEMSNLQHLKLHK